MARYLNKSDELGVRELGKAIKEPFSFSWLEQLHNSCGDKWQEDGHQMGGALIFARLIDHAGPGMCFVWHAI